MCIFFIEIQAICNENWRQFLGLPHSDTEENFMKMHGMSTRRYPSPPKPLISTSKRLWMENSAALR
ncbi:MAG: hypothetical protein RLZ35_716 [Pseudomonadota bacterium]|jgi:hypothetical protein